ncbi:17813_t:CDS:2 [Dentiscutata erythropus]|uniref:17813_t:CDS:1 n=1 Tax=Dentiscutata erythropus TaxID=1348616 RepID=A0A9N9B2D1_9GLOM|nr:17813_t:CDS:2 [Dentiscutata erythropus]
MSFHEALIKRIFKIEDLLVKQQEAIQNIQEAQHSQKEYYDKNLKHNTLKIGDKSLWLVSLASLFD